MNRTQLILFGSLALIVVIAVLMVLGVIPGLKQNVNTASANLVMWSYDDSPDIWNQVISVYNSANPNIRITYVQKDPATFESDLVDALAAGNGPDIWTIKQSWILKHKDKVFPLPEVSLSFTKSDFQNLFADATFGFVQGASIIALPLSLDTLALYYNKDIFNSANIPNPPATWDDVLADAQKTSVISLTGDIVQSGIALGSVQNIDHAVDIISALFMQSGLSILDPAAQRSDLSGSAASDALQFYRSFSDPLRHNFSWSDALPQSVDAFASGKTAMMIGFASDNQRITERNQRLNFGIAPLPQQKGQTIRVNYGIASGLTVSRNSKSPLEAWRFVIFATTYPDAVKYYLNAAQKPPAYRQYVSANFLAPFLQVFQTQVLSARTWLQPDESRVLSIFKTMVQSSRGSVSNTGSAVSTAGAQLEGLLK